MSDDALLLENPLYGFPVKLDMTLNLQLHLRSPVKTMSTHQRCVRLGAEGEARVMRVLLGVLTATHRHTSRIFRFGVTCTVRVCHHLAPSGNKYP